MAVNKLVYGVLVESLSNDLQVYYKAPFYNFFNAKGQKLALFNVEVNTILIVKEDVSHYDFNAINGYIYPLLKTRS